MEILLIEYLAVGAVVGTVGYRDPACDGLLEAATAGLLWLPVLVWLALKPESW